MECSTSERSTAAPAAGAAIYIVRRPKPVSRVFDTDAFRALDFARAEDAAIWTREWVCIGSTHDIPKVGDLLPYTVGDHAIHVQRMPDGSLAGRFNKAQHGGCRIVPLQCQQGAKTPCSFTSCGHSRDQPAIPATELGEGTPQMFQYLGLRPERLLPVRVASFGRLLFASLDPFGDTFDASAERLAACLHDADDARWPPHEGIWIEAGANWKLAGQHLMNASAPDCRDASMCVEGSNDEDGADALWLFPNLIVLRNADSLCAVVLQPLSLTRTLCRIHVFAREDAAVQATVWQARMNARAQEAAIAQSAIEGGGINGRGCDVAGQLDDAGRWMQGAVLSRLNGRMPTSNF